MGRDYYRRNKAKINRRVAMGARARALGMTRHEYESLGSDPGKECAICGAGPDSPRNGRYRSKPNQPLISKRLAIDHSHTTGTRRGFLCSNCNRALGYAEDDPSLLRRMAEYLEKGAFLAPMGTHGQHRDRHCSVDGCERPFYALDFCRYHWARRRATGSPEPPAARPTLCAVEKCDHRIFGHGYCRNHMRRWQKYGDPLKGQHYKTFP